MRNILVKITFAKIKEKLYNKKSTLKNIQMNDLFNLKKVKLAYFMKIKYEQLNRKEKNRKI